MEMKLAAKVVPFIKPSGRNESTFHTVISPLGFGYRPLVQVVIRFGFHRPLAQNAFEKIYSQILCHASKPCFSRNRKQAETGPNHTLLGIGNDHR